ncbi:MAG: outer membrane protein assembly factor BamD [Sedimentisphaerales bacterium]|nr:outer membrane protein assembly factor BamD [Sedimentisphaerales bacterium]
MYGRDKKYYLILLVICVYLITGQAFSAKTWKLEDEKDFQVVSETSQNEYAVQTKYLKSLIDQGKVELIQPQVNKIKKNFPDLAGPDFDAFIKGEEAYAEGNFTKAVREYDSFMKKYPHSGFLEAALEREYSIAQAYLNGQKKRIMKIFKIRGYAEGVKVMDRVIERSGNLPLAVKASIAIAESYEKRGKYADAYERWSQVSSRWPTGETGKNALLAMARCKHADYRGPNYDVSSLISAKSYYENFMMRYPEDAKKYEIDKRLAQIREQIAYKEYEIAQYYHRTGSNEAADIYCSQIMETWPDTTAAKRTEKIVEKIENAPQKQKHEKESKWNIKKLIMP